MEIVFRALIMFIVLFTIVKLVGKKQIQNLTLYDYILSITIGSIAADSIISLDTPLYNGLIALVVFAVISYLSSYISYYNHDIEEVIDGNPLILFENNNFNYQNLDNAKISIAKFLETCRLKNCFDINEIDCAILEASGDISILLKEKNQPITNNDLKSNIKKNSNKQTFNYSVIVDGIINEDELKMANKTGKWLNKYLKDNNKRLENIALFTIDKNDNITILSRN